MTRQEQREQAAIEYCSGNKGADARVRGAFLIGAEWADRNPQSHWHDAQGDDLPKDRQHCLIHYGGTKYCDFELAFFNAVDECFVKTKNNNYKSITMTQEEKAKAYNEALERASKLRFQNPSDTVSQMVEYIFPELKESEDERIRKMIINHLTQER